MTISIKVEGLNNAKIFDSRGNEIDQVHVDASSNQLLPVKVRTLIGELQPGNYPFVFDVEALEQSDHKTVIRTRREKSTFIIPR